MEAAKKVILGARQIVAFSGAGLSAESGISTFRDPKKSGMWNKFDPMKLASPEGFANDPKLVIDWYDMRRRDVSATTPNPAHHALAARSGLTHITQNVDNLLERAGARDVLHLHGSLIQDRCNNVCGYIENVDLANPPGLRCCPRCGGSLRPNVVWFGEILDENVLSNAHESCLRCDVFLAIGTSATVFPAAGLIDIARSSGARIITINTNERAHSNSADIELIGKAGKILPELLC